MQIRPSLDEFKRYHKKDKINCVEIGVLYGENALSILSVLDNINKIYLVDIVECEGAKDYLKSFNDKIEYMIPMPSIEAAKLVPDKSLDYIYIDGDHRYEGFMDDLNAWYPKLADGGMIAGHDYFATGVSKAAKEFFADKNKQISVVTIYDPELFVFNNINVTPYFSDWWVYNTESINGCEFTDEILSRRCGGRH